MDLSSYLIRLLSKDTHLTRDEVRY